MEVELKGLSALITGASRGLGKSIAVEFGRAGANIVIVGRDREALGQTAREASAAGAPAVEIHQSDLTDPQAADKAVKATVERFGRLDVLVNCAGDTKRGSFFDLTDADWADGYALKFHGCVRLCREAWPHLAERRGAIVNIVGVGSKTPSRDFTIGGSVNSALLNFTKALADLGIKQGVRVNAVNPGFFDTDRLTRKIDTYIGSTGGSRQQAEAEILSSLKIDRFGKPEEVAALSVFLASSHATYIHGATIDIDGGATRGL
ncbi:MAG TPA: SDR family oxidoreductase [Aliidongia sp.]|uniref:SDR family oxidoreductase n=1 Tax=Aliidongia sp. TaxID=1914230 RepID=UPI002DDDAE42|nr:SDR family oxidoreductase [Aliidongia sp.]HEV2673051.1 SDR family oxidoreductase [Aliidongia sp.]